MVRASRQDPGLGAHLEVRLRRPEIGGHRKLRHGLFCLPAVHIIDNQPETVPQVNLDAIDRSLKLAGGKAVPQPVATPAAPAPP